MCVGVGVGVGVYFWEHYSILVVVPNQVINIIARKRARMHVHVCT